MRNGKMNPIPNCPPLPWRFGISVFSSAFINSAGTIVTFLSNKSLAGG
jgi:hypothetical protein